MNKREKEVIQNQLNNEKEVLRKIKGVYEDALTGIDDKIKLLMSDKLTQSKIYQIEYQKALKGQISAILDSMNTQQYEKVSDYLKTCYEDGFLGTMYDLQGQGVPLIFPIDQEQMVQAIQKDTKLSKPLYKKLGQNVEELKGTINSEISRGIASGYSYADIARNITLATVSVGINRTMTIARTEGHRVNQEASYHAQIKAKERGADVVKQWDSTLDKRTRNSHAMLDGQIREVEEPFEINGYEAMHPCNFGVAKEDINCRCAVLQRARWGITDEEYYSKWNGEKNKLVRIKAKDYNDFKEKVKEELQKPDLVEPSKLRKALEDRGVQYLEVERLSRNLSSDEIIERLGGGDMTGGSCSSLGFAYIGNKAGLDVLDFRGGTSREFFSRDANIQEMLGLEGVKGKVVKVQKEISGTMEIMKDLEPGKEYYLAVGRHAAIIRRTETGVEYLELQSKLKNGWTSFHNADYGSTSDTLFRRFGCRKTVDKIKVGSTSMIFEKPVVLIDVDSLQGNGEFRKILGYINTSDSMQKKGALGDVK